MPADSRIPLAHRACFEEIAALITPFGETHLDAELTGFAIELWRQLWRRRAPDCLRGKPEVWASSVVLVIARMNFLFNRDQPLHLTHETIPEFYGTKKSTISNKASEIERTLKLQQYSEPGLCRSALLEQFTIVELADGMVLPWKTGKEMGFIPADAKIGDMK